MKVARIHPEVSEFSQKPNGALTVRALVNFSDESGQYRQRKVTLRTDWGVTYDEGVARAQKLREVNPNLELSIGLRIEL